MLNAKHEHQESKVDSRFEKVSRIGDPEGIIFIVHCLMNGTNSLCSLTTILQSEKGRKATEVEMSVLLLTSMGLVTIKGDKIICSELLSANYQVEDFSDWFEDEFIQYVMDNDIIDIDTITYEISSDAYLMSPSCIKRKYACFRNLLVDFHIIALRTDTKYTILQKLDKYISRPDVRRKITEKQLFAQLEKKKELGNHGEEWVLSYEKRRITEPELNIRIKRISLIDVSAGYDIVSFNSNESISFDRFIEVKTYKGKEHFHWSHNEIEKAGLMGENYFIYLVDADCLELTDYEPHIIQDPIKQIGESEGWAKRPDSYLVEKVIESKTGDILPLFTNIDNPAPVPYPVLIEPYRPIIEINTPEIKINAKTLTTARYDEEPQYSMVAEPVDVRTLPIETRNEILEKSLKTLFGISDYKGNRLFMRAEQWIGVYRDAVELGFSIENDYGFFVEQIRNMQIENFPFTCTVEILEKLDKGIFEKPVEEWSFEHYQSLNNGRFEKTFKDLHSVAKEFAKILKSNTPQKRVVASNASNISFNASVGQVIAHVDTIVNKEDTK